MGRMEDPGHRTVDETTPEARVLGIPAPYALLGILAIALLVRVACFQGMVGLYDDVGYAEFAHQMATGTYEPPPPTNYGTFGLRWGIVAPTALAYRLFGINDVSIALYPLLCSLAGIVLLYLFGRRLFDERTGLLAALLLAFFPLDIQYATRLWPDLPFSLLGWTAVYLFLRVDPDGTGAAWDRLAGPFLVGLVLGLSYLTKSTGVFFLLLVGLMSLWRMGERRRILWRYAFVLVGFFLVWGAETGYYAMAAGNPFYKAFVIETGYNLHPTFSGAFYKGARLVSRLTYEFVVMLLISFLSFGLYYWLVLIGAVYLLVRRDRASYFPLFLLLFMYLLLNFWSTSFKSYEPMRIFARNTFPMTLPALLVVARFFLLLSGEGFFARHETGIRRSLVVLAAGAATCSLGILVLKGRILESFRLLYESQVRIVPWEIRKMMLEPVIPSLLLIGLCLALLFFWVVRRVSAASAGERGQALQRVLPATLTLIVAITSFFFAVGYARGMPHFERAISPFLVDRPPKPIYTDRIQTMRVLPFYLGYVGTDRLRDIEEVEPATISDAYVLVNRVVIRLAQQQAREGKTRQVNFPEMLLDPPESWKLIQEVYDGNVRLYEVDGMPNP